MRKAPVALRHNPSGDSPALRRLGQESADKPAEIAQPACYVVFNYSFVGDALDVSGLSFLFSSCRMLINHTDHFVKCIQTCGPLTDHVGLVLYEVFARGEQTAIRIHGRETQSLR